MADAETFLKKCVNKLLSEQMPSGEFGLSRQRNVVGIVSPYHNNVYGQKANSFVTMYAIELLTALQSNQDAIFKAINWFHTKVSNEGYFVSDVPIYEQVEDLVTGKITSVPRTIKIYRHTAEALHSFFLREGVTELSIKMFINLLNAQNKDGGWSASSENNVSQLLATSFTLKAITSISINNIVENAFPKYDQERQRRNIELSIERALNWFSTVYKTTGGLFYCGIEKAENKAFYTGIVLGMSPKLFYDTYPSMTKDLVSQLLRCSRECVWMNSDGIDVNGTARILSALIKLKCLFEIDFPFDSAIDLLAAEVIRLDYKIDPATLCFIIDILYHYISKESVIEAEAINSIVAVYCGQILKGTGTIVTIGEKKYCITCKHIFNNKQDGAYSIRFKSGKEIIIDFPFSDIGIDCSAKDDVAVLALNTSDCYGLKMGDAKIGSRFSTFGFGETTRGRGSWRKEIKYIGETHKGFLEFSCENKTMEHGYSGAPILDENNAVVGLVQAIKNETVYAIPAIEFSRCLVNIFGG